MSFQQQPPVYLGHYSKFETLVPADGVEGQAFIASASGGSGTSRLACTLLDGSTQTVTFTNSDTAQAIGAVTGQNGALVMRGIGAQPTSPEATDTSVASGCTVTIHHLI